MVYKVSGQVWGGKEKDFLFNLKWDCRTLKFCFCKVEKKAKFADDYYRRRWSAQSGALFCVYALCIQLSPRIELFIDVYGLGKSDGSKGRQWFNKSRVELFFVTNVTYHSCNILLSYLTTFSPISYSIEF